MNAPHDPTDPLFESLAEEAADLPARAAIAARQRTAQRRQNRRRLMQVAVLALLGITTWQLVLRDDRQPTTGIADHVPTGDQPTPMHFDSSPEPDAPYATTPPSPQKNKGDIVTMDTPLPLPSGLDEEQAEFVKALPDVPLLFVRDNSGKVIHIHVIERD